MKKKYVKSTFVVLSFGLNACSPSIYQQDRFEIESTYDKFRETSMCTTKNLYVEAEGASVLFELVSGKGTKGIQEYFFTIDISNQAFTYNFYWVGDYIILTIDNGKPIKLELSYRAYGENINLSNNRYAKSAVVPFEIARNLAKAKSVRFELELRDNKKASLTGVFSQKNLEQIKKFQQVCMAK